MSTNETKGGGWEELFSDSKIRVHDKQVGREPELVVTNLVVGVGLKIYDM